MKIAPIALTLAFLLSTAAMAEQPAVGDLFEAPSSMKKDAFEWRFRNWTFRGRGEAIGMGRFVLFEKAGSFMIAATEVLTPSKAFGHDGVQRILATKITTVAPGEEQVDDCYFVTLRPALSYYNRKTGIARGFFVIGAEINEERWFVNKDRASCDTAD